MPTTVQTELRQVISSRATMPAIALPRLPPVAICLPDALEGSKSKYFGQFLSLFASRIAASAIWSRA